MRSAWWAEPISGLFITACLAAGWAAAFFLANAWISTR